MAVPDLVLTGAKIWTGRGCPIDGGPTSIAIAQGRITDIGSEDRTTALAGDTTTVIDVGGRRLVPGLVDSHLHAVRAGWSYLDELDWTEVYSIGDALETVRRAAAEREPGTWITSAGGWHPTQFTEKRMPTRDELEPPTDGSPAWPLTSRSTATRSRPTRRGRGRRPARSSRAWPRWGSPG
jgi:predicted amidohydrolase YtcJ